MLSLKRLWVSRQILTVAEKGYLHQLAVLYPLYSASQDLSHDDTYSFAKSSRSKKRAIPTGHMLVLSSFTATIEACVVAQFCKMMLVQQSFHDAKYNQC